MDTEAAASFEGWNMEALTTGDAQALRADSGHSDGPRGNAESCRAGRIRRLWC
jgi:hypothetical protein